MCACTSGRIPVSGDPVVWDAFADHCHTFVKIHLFLFSEKISLQLPMDSYPRFIRNFHTVSFTAVPHFLLHRKNIPAAVSAAAPANRQYFSV